MSISRAVDNAADLNRARGVALASLVDRARHGDHDAFARIVEDRLDHSFRIAAAVLGNESDARDATQDAFIAAWRHLPRLREPERFDAWLHRLLINSCRDIQRRKRRVREIRLESQEVPVASHDERAADRIAVAAALDHLSVDERAILVLHHLEGLPVAVIADRMAIPVGTAKWRLHEARQALERALEGDR